MAPQQGSQQGPVMQPGQPPLIYYQQHPMAPQAAPVYFHPMPTAQTQMMDGQMNVMQQMPPQMSNAPQQQQSQRQMGMPQSMEMNSARTAPLTSSTPLPTSLEYETMQRDTARNRNIQFRYHR